MVARKALTYKVARKSSPNRETRITLYPVPRKRQSLLSQAAEFLDVPCSEVASLGTSPQSDSTNLTFVANSKPRDIICQAMPWKRTRFGRNAMTRLLHAGGACDREDPNPGHYLFLTATLPGDDIKAKWGLAYSADKIINRFKAILSKRIRDRREFYVWENQGRGALHFHYCVYVPRQEDRDWIHQNFKRWMVGLYDYASQEIGSSLWGRHSELSFEQKEAILQAKVEVVYSSVNAYMAGYLADGGSKHSNDHKHHFYPRRWFGVSRPLSALIEKHTEKLEDEFPSFREASEFYSELGEHFSEDALTHKEFRHKVGVGKTRVFFHTQETQAELWQQKMALTHSPNNHPNISRLIQLTMSATTDGWTLCMQSKQFRQQLSPVLVNYFEDSSYLISLRRGSISQTHLRMLSAAFLLCDWSSDSRPQIKRFARHLMLSQQVQSKYHHQMTWNQFGWLNNAFDFVDTVDTNVSVGYARTSYDEHGSQVTPDSSHAPVASEPKVTFHQLEITNQ